MICKSHEYSITNIKSIKSIMSIKCIISLLSITNIINMSIMSMSKMSIKSLISITSLMSIMTILPFCFVLKVAVCSPVSRNKADLMLCKAMCIGIAYSSNIGGITTLPGTSPNLIFSEYLHQ